MIARLHSNLDRVLDGIICATTGCSSYQPNGSLAMCYGAQCIYRRTCINCQLSCITSREADSSISRSNRVRYIVLCLDMNRSILCRRHIPRHYIIRLDNIDIMIERTAVTCSRVRCISGIRSRNTYIICTAEEVNRSIGTNRIDSIRITTAQRNCRTCNQVSVLITNLE